MELIRDQVVTVVLRRSNSHSQRQHVYGFCTLTSNAEFFMTNRLGILHFDLVISASCDAQVIVATPKHQWVSLLMRLSPEF